MACTLETVGVLVLLWIGWKLVDYLIRLPRIGKYNERYIFITGCDTGFGNATAKELDRMGCHVFAGCLTAKGEHDLKSESSDRLKTLRLDVTEKSSVRRAYDFVKSNLPEGKGLWGLVNNAGIVGQMGRADFLTIEDYKSCMDVNAYGHMDCSITFLRLIKMERGRVVNMASMVGRFSPAGGSVYSVSKYAVEAFSDSLRREMHDYGVKVSIIEPGHFKTDIITTEKVRSSMMKAWDRAPDHIKEEYGKDYVDKAVGALSDMMDKATNTDISQVVNAYIHALTSVHPRPRYLISTDARVLVMLQALPEWLSDYIFRLAVRNSPKPAALLPKS